MRTKHDTSAACRFLQIRYSSDCPVNTCAPYSPPSWSCGTAYSAESLRLRPEIAVIASLVLHRMIRKTLDSSAHLLLFCSLEPTSFQAVDLLSLCRPVLFQTSSSQTCIVSVQKTTVDARNRAVRTVQSGSGDDSQARATFSTLTEIVVILLVLGSTKLGDGPLHSPGTFERCLAGEAFPPV